jgi:cell shape-determining protein MreD
MKIAGLLCLTACMLLVAPIIDREVGQTIIRPNVLLVPMIVGVLYCPGSSAVVTSAAIGLGCDCLADSRLGPRMAAFALLAAFGTFLLPQRPRSLLTVLMFAFALTFAAAASSLAISMSGAGQPFAWRNACAEIAGCAVATTVLVAAPRLAAWVLWWSAVRRPMRALFGRRDRRPVY